MSLCALGLNNCQIKFVISHHTALILGVHPLISYLKLICEDELHSLPNKQVNGEKDHGKNYIKVRPPLVRHLLCNRLWGGEQTIGFCYRKHQPLVSTICMLFFEEFGGRTKSVLPFKS